MKRIIHAAKRHAIYALPVPLIRKWADQRVKSSWGQTSSGTTKQLLIDVSVICKMDSRTGIQRVVRALLLQLLENPPYGYQVCPVFATRDHGYRYAPNFLGDASPLDSWRKGLIEIETGDIFLGLDLTAHLLPRHHLQLAHWKQKGAKVCFFVYDLLPLQHPEWFNDKTVNNFRRWIKSLAMLADQAICISNSVKIDLADWLKTRFSLQSGVIDIDVIALGGDIDASLPTTGLPVNIQQILDLLASKPNVLIVGTLEPRKGHIQTIGAFESLWQLGHDINLIIVGRPGWKTEALQEQLNNHPEKNKHLFWFDDASDEFLGKLYEISQLVLIASKGEGFGLPLIEALRYGKSVLARDLPVFRETTTNLISFFSGDSSQSLAESIKRCLAQPILTTKNTNCEISWRQSADQMISVLGLAKTNSKAGNQFQQLGVLV